MTEDCHHPYRAEKKLRTPLQQIEDFLDEGFRLPRRILRRYARILLYRGVEMVLGFLDGGRPIVDLRTKDGKRFPGLDDMEERIERNDRRGRKR